MNSLVTSITAGEDLEKGIAVKLSSGDAIAVTGTTDSVFGVTYHGANSGDEVAVVRSGEAYMQVDDANIADGDLVAIDANGRAAKDSGGGETVVGEALEDGVAKPAGEDAAFLRTNLKVDKS
jgi:hypothetical protein